MAIRASLAEAQRVDWEKPPRTVEERAVAHVDSVRVNALLAGDTAVVRRVYADGFRSILPSGVVRTKTQLTRLNRQFSLSGGASRPVRDQSAKSAAWISALM